MHRVYEAARTQYEDERRLEVAKSNAEVTRQQIALGTRLAEALEGMFSPRPVLSMLSRHDCRRAERHKEPAATQFSLGES